MSSSSNNRLSSASSSSSSSSSSSGNQGRDDAFLSQFQAFWDKPIQNMIDDLLAQDPITCDYASLYLRLTPQLEQDRSACEEFIKHHQDTSTLSHHQLSIIGTIYSAQQKLDQAKECFEIAKKDNAMALNCLGYMYHQGHGVTQDYNQARSLYEQAAAKGSASALNNLGLMYHQGHGVTQDYNQARSLYEQAAAKGDAKGDATALYNLGFMYHRGHGVTQDYNQARSLYEQAAAKGSASALNNLGLMYHQGHGVTQDYNQAAMYYRQAAEKNITESLTALRNLQTSNPDSPTILYHAALGTKDLVLVRTLKDLIETDPKSIVTLAMQDSIKVLRDTLRLVTPLGDDAVANQFIHYVTSLAAKRIAPFFDTAYQATPFPSNIISTITSYMVDPGIHEDYIKPAIEYCRVAAGIKSPTQDANNKQDAEQQQIPSSASSSSPSSSSTYANKSNRDPSLFAKMEEKAKAAKEAAKKEKQEQAVNKNTNTSSSSSSSSKPGQS